MSAAAVLARTLKYQVRISRGEGAGTLFHFDQSLVTIGRGAENDIVLANDPKVSRQHLELRIQAGNLIAKNVSKKNFVLLDGAIVEEKICEKGFKLQLGGTELEIEFEGQNQKDPEKSSPALSLVTTNIVEPKAIAPVFPTPQGAMKQSAALKKQSASRSQQQYSQPRPMATRSSGNSRVRFYIIVALVIGAFLWLMSGPAAKKVKESSLRTDADVLRSIEESANAVKDLKQKQMNQGQASMQYQLAEQNYVKGFRDYMQGQYARAMVSFQAALSFYPQHEMARKYLVLSQRKFDESVDQSMSLGRSYYKRQNWRLCQSAFANVMIMLKDPAKAKYKEAKQIYDECSVRLGGGF